MHEAVRICIAAVWLGYGIYCKLLRQVPRHERIVERFVGRYAPPLTRCIGVGEALIGAWTLSAIAPLANAILQSVLVVTMNTLELMYARDLLAAPRGMLAANAVLLAAVWWLAL